MSKNGNLINFYPIVDSKLIWKNVEIDLGKNLSKIKIKQDGKEIYVDGSFFFDVNNVLSQLIFSRKDIEYQASDEFDKKEMIDVNDSTESYDSNI